MDKGVREIKEEFIKTIFEHNQGLIELADNKANIILGINSILIPLIFGVTGINFIDLINNNLFVNAFILNISFIMGLTFLSISFFFSVLVIKARLSEDYKNHIFFKTIIEYELNDFKKKIIEMSKDEIIQDFLTEIYALAKINEIKYKRYKIALWTLILGVLFLLVGYILIAGFNFSLT